MANPPTRSLLGKPKPLVFTCVQEPLLPVALRQICAPLTVFSTAAYSAPLNTFRLVTQLLSAVVRPPVTTLVQVRLSPVTLRQIWAPGAPSLPQVPAYRVS